MTKKIFASCVKWFVLVALVGVFLVHSLFDVVCKPKDYETVNVFITAESCDKKAVEDKLTQATGVKAASYCFSTSMNNYGSVLATSGLLLCDVVILPQSLLPQNNVAEEFAPLEPALLQKFGIDTDGLVFFEKDGTTFGIEVWNKASGKNLMDGLVRFGNENCYLLVNLARPNAAPYSTGEHVTQNAFLAVAALIG